MTTRGRFLHELTAGQACEVARWVTRPDLAPGVRSMPVAALGFLRPRLTDDARFIRAFTGYREDATIPPIVVAQGELANGNHRLLAAMLAGLTMIDAEFFSCSPELLPPEKMR